MKALGDTTLWSSFDGVRAAETEEISVAHVEEIVLSPFSPAARNDKVTLAYYVLSRQIAQFLNDHVNANWCTFAVWGSASAGMGIRTATTQVAVDRVTQSLPLTGPMRRKLRSALGRFRSGGKQLVPRLLAAGNRGVFWEMGMATAQFLELVNNRGDRSDEELISVLARNLRPLPPELGNVWPGLEPDLLVDGFAAYLKASTAIDDKARAEWILLGNLRFAGHEQARLQTALRLAFRRESMVGDAGSASGRAQRFWERLMTRGIVEVGLGGESLRVSNDLQAPADSSFSPRELKRIENPELQTFLRSLDRFQIEAGGTFDGRGTAVRNWVDFDERMKFIAALFRSRQQHEAIWRPPFPDTDRAAIAAGHVPHRLAITRVAGQHNGLVAGVDLSAARLDACRHRGDGDADAAVESFWRDHGDDSDRAFGALVRELRANPPTEDGPIGSYLHRPLDVPGWADPERLARGQEFYSKLQIPISLALLVASLPGDFGGAAGAEVLRRTSRLSGDAARRIEQTARFVLDVSIFNPLDPDSDAARSIRGVRLLHAGARQLIEHPPASADTFWDPSWGVPVNQEDMVATLISFVVPPLDFMGSLGWFYDVREAEDFMHLWCVVGYMLGVDEELLVTEVDGQTTSLTVEQAQLFFARIRARQVKPSDAGIHLTAELLHSLHTELPRFIRHTGWVPALVRLGIGDDLAALLDVPPRGLADYFLDRAARFGTGVSGEAFYRWVLLRVGAFVGEAWYRSFVDGGYGTDLPFRS